MITIQEQAVNKINNQAQDCQEKRVPAEPIIIFLKKHCVGNDEFGALVIQEHKTLIKCFNFVFERAKNHLNGVNGWIEDNDIYMMAEDYFSFDDAELERQKAEEAKKREEERQQREFERKQNISYPIKADGNQISLFEGE